MRKEKDMKRRREKGEGRRMVGGFDIKGKWVFWGGWSGSFI